MTSEPEFRARTTRVATGSCVMVKLGQRGLWVLYEVIPATRPQLPDSAFFQVGAAVTCGRQRIPPRSNSINPMTHAFLQLNWLAVVGTAVIGFLLGWLWFSNILFAKPWMAEMHITEEKMKEAAQKGMAKFFVQGFIYTLLSTLALAVLVKAIGSPNCIKGAELGAFVGLLAVGTRLLNAGVWEQRSLKLQAITIGHEVVLFALQGAVLAVWR